MRFFEFSATVNGVKRTVIVPMQGQYAGDAEEAELLIMNDEGLYNEFYRGAREDDDFDGDLEDVTISEVDE